MVFKRFAGVLLCALGAAAFTGCSTLSRPSPPVAPAAAANQIDLRAAYAEIGRAGGRVFTIAPEQSAVRIYAFRAGRAARLGHNHVLSAPRFAGFLFLPSGGATDGRFDLAFRLDELEIDNPAYRSGLGAAFSSVIDADAVASTREHLLGADNLQADQFPFIRIHSLQISGEAPKFAVKAQVQMHGQQHELWIALDVEGLPERLSVSGSFVLRQSDFGVQPYSLLGGLLSVRDEVVVDFKLAGSCTPELSSAC
jgi:polyisoprenoid-binding protein YceI